MTHSPNPRRIIKEDGIIDQVAVRRVAAGDLRVAATQGEISAAVLLLADRGMSEPDIAAKVGYHERSVGRILSTARARAGISSAPELEPTDETLRRIKNLQGLGLSLSRIAAATGIGLSTLCRLTLGRQSSVTCETARKIESEHDRLIPAARMAS